MDITWFSPGFWTVFVNLKFGNFHVTMLDNTFFLQPVNRSSHFWNAEEEPMDEAGHF